MSAKIVHLITLQRIIALLILCAVLNLSSCGPAICNTSTYYEHTLEYQVNSISFSEYDKDDSSVLLSESVLEDFQESYSIIFKDPEPQNDYYGEYLILYATTEEGYSARLYLTVGSKLDTLNLNETEIDGEGEFFGFWGFDLDDTPENRGYEEDPEVTVTLMSDGYHVVGNVYPYIISGSEYEYYDTIQVELVVADIILVGEPELKTTESCTYND